MADNTQQDNPVLVVRRVEKVGWAWDWDRAPWSEAEEGRIEWYHPKSTAHRPEVRFRVVYDDAALGIQFRVKDCHVRCVRTEHQSAVFKDSCVESFLDPTGQGLYLNFELNCGGALLVHRRLDAANPRARHIFTPAEIGTIEIFHTMPRVVEPEIQEPVTWRAGLRIPFEFFGVEPPRAGAEWRGNFYKCADETSMPHWGAWNPVGERLDFHQPGKFGVLRFG